MNHYVTHQVFSALPAMQIPQLPYSRSYQLETESQLTNLPCWPLLYSLSMDRIENITSNSYSIVMCVSFAAGAFS
jgi:hypothetical protein